MLGHRALDEALVVGLERLRRALAAHRPAQTLGLPHAEAGERLRDLEHLVLEDDRPERVAQRRLERRVQVGDLVGGVDAQPLAALDVRVDRAADDRPRADDRDLDRDVVEVLRARAPQRAHLRARLDLKDAGRLGVLDALVRRGVVVRDPAEVDPLAAPRGRCARRSARRRTASRGRAGRSSESPRRRRSPCPTARAGGPPSRPARAGRSPRAGASRRSSRRSAGRDGAAGRRPPRPGARARPSDRSAGPARARVSMSRSTSRDDQPSLPRATRSISPGGSPSALPISRIAPRARYVGKAATSAERSRAVALVHARDQDLADVAREVEVDVRQRRELLVEEAPEQQLVGDRVDVAEAGEVADDRGDARAAAAAGRQQRPRASPRARAPRRRPRARARAGRDAAGRSRRGRARR